MIDFIQRTIFKLFKNHVWLGVGLMSLLPMVELKGAIPFGISVQVWGDRALNIYQAFIISYIGSSLAGLIIVLFLKPVFNLMKRIKPLGRVVNYFEQRFLRLGAKISNRTKRLEGEQELAQAVESNAQSNSDENGAQAALSKGEKQAISNESAQSNFDEGKAQAAKANSIKAELVRFFSLLLFVANPLPLTGVWTGSAIAVMLKIKKRIALPAIFLGNFIAGVLIALTSVLFDWYFGLFYIMLAVLFLSMMAAIVISKLRKRGIGAQK